MRPVSCCGMKPLGMLLYRLMFNAMVATKIKSMTGGCLKAQPKLKR